MGINRSIEISASADSFKSTMKSVGDDLSRAFESANQEIERVTGNSKDFGDVLQGRMTAIERSIDTVFGKLVSKSKEQNATSMERLTFLQKEISLGERQLRTETEKAKLMERMRYQDALKNAQDDDATPKEQQVIKSMHQSQMSQIDEEAKFKELQMRGLRERFMQHRDDSDEEREDEVDERKQGRDPLYVPKQVGQGLTAGYGIAGVLTISGFVEKMINEGKQLDEAEASTRGLGATIRGSGQGYGVKRSEFLKYGAGVVQAAGDVGYDVKGQLEFEKRFSQGQGSLSGLAGGLRTEGKGRSAQEVALEMMNFFKRSKVFGIEKGDFSQLAEKLQFNNEMLQQQGQQMHETNATTNAQIMAAFGQAGIDDQRAMSYNNSVNDAIRSPSSDFTQAFMFRSLRRQNPNSSLLDILKIQEQGIYGKGSFGQIMEDLKGSFQGDALTMSTSKAFGLQYHQAEEVLKLSPEQLDRIGSKEDIEGVLRGEGEDVITAKTGKGGAGIVQRRMAQMEDWFGKQGKKAIVKIEEYTNAFEKGGFSGLFSKISGDLYNAVASAMEALVDTVAEKFDEAMRSLTEKMIGFFGETDEERNTRLVDEKEKIDRGVVKKYGGAIGDVVGGGGIDSWLKSKSRLSMVESGEGEVPTGMQSDSDKLKMLVYSLLYGSAESELQDKPMSPKTTANWGATWRDSPEFKENQASFKEAVEALNKLQEGDTEKSGDILKDIRDLMMKSNMTAEEASKIIFNETFTTK